MRIISALALLLAFAPIFGGCSSDCEVGQARPCYTGQEVTRTKGLCRDGVQACVNGNWAETCSGEILPSAESCDQVDNDCDGTSDNDVLNACGGCSTLEGVPGETCQGCGRWACDAQERVKCVPPAHPTGTQCTGENGCNGTWRCSPEGEVACAAPRKNSCGVCGGSNVTGVGDACTSAAGCEGELECNFGGTGTLCNAKGKNNCGVCDAPNVADINGTCLANGCSGAYVCNETGLGKTCVAPTKNECGKCGGDPVTGLGVACVGENGCAGLTACDAAGTGTTCVAPAKNECGVCGGAVVADLGVSCTNAASGCTGEWACNTAGTGRDCNAPAKNECGLCGGPALVGAGTDCGGLGACAGTLTCNTAKDALVCTFPGRPATCTGANGCVGAWACNANGDALECVGPPANACGTCNGPELIGKGDACNGTGPCGGTQECNAAGTALICKFTGQGTACTASNTCAGTLECNTAGDATVCSAPGMNACDLCGGPVLSGKGDACTTTLGCAGVKTCNAARDALTCESAQSCGPNTDHLVISEIAGTGGGNDLNDFVEIYNPTNAPINIKGWMLFFRLKDDSTATSGTTLVSFTTDTIIGSHKFFLIGSPGYAGSPGADVKWTGSVNLAHVNGGHIFIVNNTSKPATPTSTNVVDMVGWANSDRHEGSANAPALGSGSIERKAHANATAASMTTGSDKPLGNALDTNQNGTDFVVRGTRDPQNAASPAEPL